MANRSRQRLSAARWTCWTNDTRHGRFEPRAKLERAVASGMLFARGEWLDLCAAEWAEVAAAYKRELTVWTGLPKETADQIDVTSYACYVTRKQSSSWGGTVAPSISGAQLRA